MAVRIAGVNLPDNKRIIISLTYIYGIGKTRAQKILLAAGIDENTRTGKLLEKDINNLRIEVEKKHILEGELRRKKMMDIKRLKEIGSYRGSRHARRLPARGQRTRTNGRTIRGNKRVTMGSGKRSVEKK